MSDLTIKAAQHGQPWAVPYSPQFSCCSFSMPHLYASHTTLHAAKSVGKLAAVFEALDHSGAEICDDQKQTVRDMAADLMTAALRLANLYRFDLATELERRVEEKNGVGIYL